MVRANLAGAGGRLALLGLLLVLLLAPAGFYPLTESTEGRYGEIAREMVASGNYLEPVFNGVKHFHKPPLSYWLIGAGYQLFGVNAFGARFFGALAAIVAVWFLYRLAVLVLGDRDRGLAAALIFASSLLFQAVARVVATDIYLTCFTLGALYFLFRQILGPRSRLNVAAYAFFLGLGFLTKGPIIFLFTLLPFLVAKLFDPAHRRVFSWGEAALGLGIFALVALPWYLAVIQANPGLLDYFLRVQTVDRVASNRFHRAKPPWFFPAVFAATFLPYLPYFFRGLLRPGLLARPARVMLVYVVVPFLVFSAAQSKLATYILPLYGAAAIFTAEALCTADGRRLRGVAVGLLALLALAPPAAIWLHPPLAGHRAVLTLAALPLAGLWWLAWRARGRLDFVLKAALLLGTIATLIFTLLTVAEPQYKGYQRLVARLEAAMPGAIVLLYGDLVPSVSFYRNAVTPVAFGPPRETQFEDDDSWRRAYLSTTAAVADFLADRDRLAVVAKPERLGEFQGTFGYDCREIYLADKHGAYDCRRQPGAPAGGER